MSGEGLSAGTEFPHTKVLEIVFWKEVVALRCNIFSLVHRLGVRVSWQAGH